ncbi:hypothetical protein JTB14_034765 [Gonioctena quinquepunctata]|nr:hypothetical protein JTB14_034765 [Gonioctena quinquepunctata]
MWNELNTYDPANAQLFSINYNKMVGKGSKKGGEAGLVPRTYSMGAQPPSLNQPLDGKINKSKTFTINEKNEDEYLSTESDLPEDYFREITKRDQDIKNQRKTPERR